MKYVTFIGLEMGLTGRDLSGGGGDSILVESPLLELHEICITWY